MNGKSATIRVLGITLAMAAVATLAGCGKAKLTVMHYPVFYDPGIKTVAVLPMANRSLHPMAGKFIADRLADRLAANGTYHVISPAELANRLAGRKIEMPANPSPEQAAAILRSLGGVDAFITGTVSQFGAGRGTYTEVYDNPYPYDGYYGYGYGRRWHRHGGYYGRYYGGYYGGYYPVYRTYTYSQAYVVASASMYRVSDGAPIYSTPTPARARITSTGGIARGTDEVLTDAADAVARQLVGTFAIVPRQIEVKTDDTLKPAIRTEGQTKYTTDFHPGEDGIYVEVALPAVAARNEFRLAVAPKKGPPVAEQSFTWKRADTTREFYFPLNEVIQAGGTGDYQVRLYSGDRAEVKRGFKIKKD